MEKISCRTKVTEILYKILQTATVSFILAGCVTNNHNPEEAFLISPENEAVSSDLCQSPSEVEMSTINNYAEELIHSYNVHYKNEEDALKDAGNTSSLWEYAVFDMGLVNPKHKYITQQINQVKKKQKYFEKQLANGHLYLYHIVNELKSRDMPLELAVIPIIESNFNPYAVSPAGAKGIWQFVPITARNFKLRVDSTYDMRRDVIASTDAALTYFNYLYKIFNDWNLAIAAYNLGEGTVLKAIKTVESGGKAIQNGIPTMLFEGHVFWKQLEARKINPNNYVKGNENILYKTWTKKYYTGRNNGEYERLKKAIKII